MLANVWIFYQLCNAMKEIKHINILDPHDCCGCTACASACPAGSITMTEDKEGFLYPSVNGETCIGCGLCIRVCPVISGYPSRKPLAVYAVKNPDEAERDNSASGGMFPMLAKAVLDKGGCVAGSRFDENMEAVHDCAYTHGEMLRFTGSKYLQSRMENTYRKVKSALKEGKPVLFTGTACQVAGLNHYLGRIPDNLITADLICHGVPSPGVWRKYLQEEVQKLESEGYSDIKVDDVRFRDKSGAGWKGYNFRIFFTAKDRSGNVCHPELSEAGKAENLFIRGFLADLYSRPSCYKCPAREFRSGSDITIGDFWGIGDLRPDFDDDKGVSAVLVNTAKGMDFFAGLDCTAMEMTYGDVLRRNRCLEKSVDETPARKAFFESSEDVHTTVSHLLRK